MKKLRSKLINLSKITVIKWYPNDGNPRLFVLLIMSALLTKPLCTKIKEPLVYFFYFVFDS